MAAKQARQSYDLVMLSLGYWAKYILPVDAATQVMALLVKAGAVPVENEMVAGEQTFYPCRPELKVEVLDRLFLVDCPTNTEQRKEYFNWLKTKYELIGATYEAESYADYLKAKEEGS